MPKNYLFTINEEEIAKGYLTLTGKCLVKLKAKLTESKTGEPIYYPFIELALKSVIYSEGITDFNSLKKIVIRYAILMCYKGFRKEAEEKSKKSENFLQLTIKEFDDIIANGITGKNLLKNIDSGNCLDHFSWINAYNSCSQSDIKLLLELKDGETNKNASIYYPSIEKILRNIKDYFSKSSDVAHLLEYQNQKRFDYLICECLFERENRKFKNTTYELKDIEELSDKNYLLREENLNYLRALFLLIMDEAISQGATLPENEITIKSEIFYIAYSLMDKFTLNKISFFQTNGDKLSIDYSSIDNDIHFAINNKNYVLTVSGIEEE